MITAEIEYPWPQQQQQSEVTIQQRLRRQKAACPIQKIRKKQLRCEDQSEKESLVKDSMFGSRGAYSIQEKKKRKQNVLGTSAGSSKHKRQVGIHTLQSKKTAPSVSKKRKFGHGKGRRIGINGEEDATAKLVSSLTPGKSKDPIGQFFRYATKSAVRKQYDIARANNRFKSILLGEFEIQENQKLPKAWKWK